MYFMKILVFEHGDNNGLTSQRSISHPAPCRLSPYRNKAKGAARWGNLPRTLSKTVTTPADVDERVSTYMHACLLDDTPYKKRVHTIFA